MSIKIYNGYSFDGSFEDLFLVLKKMKSEVLKLEKNEVYLQEVIDAVHVLDRRHLLNQYLYLDDLLNREKYPFAEDSSYLGAQLQIYKVNSKKEFLTHFDKDIKFDVVAFPLAKEKNLVLFYPSLPFHKKVLEKYKSKFKDYHYQNSTDKPSDVSSQEWRQRLKDWRRVGVLDGSPAEKGLSFSLSGKIPCYFDYYLVKEIISNLKMSDEQRVDFLIKQVVDDLVFKKITKKYKLEGNDFFKIFTTHKQEAKSETISLMSSKRMENKKESLLKKIKKYPLSQEYINQPIKKLLKPKSD